MVAQPPLRRPRSPPHPNHELKPAMSKNSHGRPSPPPENPNPADPETIRNQSLERRLERLELLYQVSNIIHSTLVPQEALALVIREAVRLMKATSGSVILINPTNGFLEIQASLGLSPEAEQIKLKVGEGITGWVARTGHPTRVGNVQADPRYIALNPKARSELAVPLEVDGELRGVLNVDSDYPEAFSHEDQSLLEELSRQAARVIHNTWLYEQIRLKARLFESLISVSHAINSTVNLDDVLEVVVQEACHLMRARMSSLLLTGPDPEWLELRASFGAGKHYARKPRLSVRESLMGVIIRRQKPMQIANVQTDNRYQNVEIARLEGLVSLLSVPVHHAGKTTGILNVYTAEAHRFSNEEIRILSALAELSSIAMDKARLYERIVDVEEQLRQNEKLSALGLLAAEVAHEIRNPLTVMKMLFHSLNLDFPPHDPRTEDCRIISEKINHLNRIVEQILTYARSSEPKPAPIAVNSLIDDLILLTRHKLRSQNVELVRDFDPAPPEILADANQLEQCFLNLILNATEAMPGGGRLTIRTRPYPATQRHPSPTGVRIEFQDTGQGMSPEEQKHIFQSLLSSSKASGTGLGLAIVRKTVESHKGSLTIRSQKNRGTTIRLRFPITPN